MTRLRKIATLAVWLVISILLMGKVVAWAELNSEDFRYCSQIEAVSDANGFFILDIDAEVFATMKGSFSDLRIFDNNGKETGFARLSPEEVREQDDYNELAIINKGALSNSEYYSFTVKDVPAGVEALTIKLDSPEYLVKAKIYGSSDNRLWQELGTKTLYCIKGHYNEIEMKGIDYRYIKFEYPRPKGETVGVSSVGYNLQQKANYETKFRSFPISQYEKEKVSVISIDLGSNNQNSRAVELTCNAKNFYRLASIEYSNDGKQWSHVSDFYIYRGLDEADKNMGTRYPLTQARYLRITIENEDNAPLQFNAAKVEIVPVRLLVKGMAEDAPYRLMWGNEQLGYPAYDIMDVIRQSDIDMGSLPVFSLKVFEQNKEHKEPETPLTERYPFLLPVALAAAVVVVGLIQYRAFKKVG